MEEGHWDLSDDKTTKKSELLLSPTSIVDTKPYAKTLGRKRSRKSKSNKRSRVRTNVSLAVRKDVINKTILRVMKRYLTKQFHECFEKVPSNCEDRMKSYSQNIRKFIDIKFQIQPSEKKITEFYLANTIYPKLMSKEYTKRLNEELGNTSKNELCQLYECMYKYSHSKLLDLFKLTPVQTLFLHFYQQGLDEVMASEQAMLKNPKLYLDAIELFKDAFMNVIDGRQLTSNV
jgi:hypothetical protein